MESKRIMIDTFRIKGEKFCHILFSWHIRKWWLVYAIPVVACLSLSFIDVRFLLVTMMLVFIMIPMMLFFIYFVYGFDADNRYNIMNKTLTADADGITLTIDKEYNSKLSTIVVPWHEVVNRQVVVGCIVLVLRSCSYKFLAIPLDSFSDEQHLRDFIVLTEANMNRNV